MIEIYKLSDLKKSGGLKKKAKPLFYYTSTDNEPDYESIARHIRNDGYSKFHTPYVFTCIYASHPEYGDVFIRQYVKIGDKEIMVSPKKLFDIIKYK